MSRLRRALAGALMLAAGLAAPIWAATPASAEEATAGLVVSLDGTDFAEFPAGSLFPADLALIPGASVSTTIWARNDSPLAGELRLAVTGATASRVTFLDSLSMLATTSDQPDGTPVPLADADDCSPLLAGETLAAGETAQVTLTLTMDRSGGNAAQASTAGAEVEAFLSQAGAPEAGELDCEPGNGIPVTGPDEPEGPNPDHGGGSAPGEDGPAAGPFVDGLPFTGFTGSGWLSPWIGVGALVAGAVIFSVARIRTRPGEQ